MKVRNPTKGTVILAGACKECARHLARDSEAWDILNEAGLSEADGSFCSLPCLNAWSVEHP